jgi:hypothetical protein
MNNLRQLGAAVGLYGNDNSDYLAFPNWDGDGIYHGVVTPGWLYTGNSITGIPDPRAYATNISSAYEFGLWFKYIKNPQTYLCPVGVESRSYLSPSPSSRPNRLSTYLMNGAVCGFGYGVANSKITEAFSPNCFLLWEADENSLGFGNPGAFTYSSGSSAPSLISGVGCLHTPAAGEVLCVSGNVELMSLRAIETEEAAAGRSLAWWSPFSRNGH